MYCVLRAPNIFYADFYQLIFFKENKVTFFNYWY